MLSCTPVSKHDHLDTNLRTEIYGFTQANVEIKVLWNATRFVLADRYTDVSENFTACNFGMETFRMPVLIKLYDNPYHETVLQICSEKCVVRRFRRCANVIECTYTNLDSTV